MWLLSTNRAELHFFASPEDVSDGYGVLSHVWGKEEQSFQDVRRIQERCAIDGTNPCDIVCEKIRRCCELAERHGYKWVWIDTCCIDKTSSAELSEAINSMFRYYALADICYRYLPDVPALDGSLEDIMPTKGGCQLSYYRGPMSESLRGSVWFTRGWTLQELIAPRFFLFLSRSWEVLGTKADLAELLPTTIPEPRMSWYGKRETTRLEDEAYCLLGLFDIHMPPLYGEGRNAFHRLQEELLKQSTDTTLFAWEDFSLDYRLHSCLFAPSPTAFKTIGDIMYTPPRQDHPSHRNSALRDGAVHDIELSVTPYGILAYIPVYRYNELLVGDFYWSRPSAVRQMRNRKLRPMLCLEEDPDSQTGSSRTVRPLYRVQCGILCIESREPGEHASWQEVLIRHRPVPHWGAGSLSARLSDRGTTLIPTMPMQLTLNAPYRFDEAHIRKFLRESQAHYMTVHGADHRPPSPSGWMPQSNCPTMLPTTYIFSPTPFLDVRGYDPYMNVRFIMIKVGKCRQWQIEQNLPWDQRVWATVHGEYISDSRRVSHALWEMRMLSDDLRHDCLTDHVSQWPALRKVFHVDIEGWLQDATLTLSFAPCPINNGATLVLDASISSLNHSTEDGSSALAVGGAERSIHPTRPTPPATESQPYSGLVSSSSSSLSTQSCSRAGRTRPSGAGSKGSNLLAMRRAMEGAQRLRAGDGRVGGALVRGHREEAEGRRAEVTRVAKEAGAAMARPRRSKEGADT
ncbi:heterokaryon incompatibility protein-domain-containing protein [Cerioporus squamosus]|nr:heterokaryon incompatibility protein-domain-containing protein [Cerioporus squamosus]